MDLILYGTSHKTASVEVRERFALSQEEVFKLLPQLKGVNGVLECLVISTCNRTEVFAVCENNFDSIVIAEVLHKFKSCEPVKMSSDSQSHREESFGRRGDLPYSSVNGGQFYSLKNLDAVRHLFRVSAGLESQMVGENQIKAQIKDAYKIAAGLKTTGTLLNKLLHMAFKVGKTVRAETNLGAGAVSISSAAVELANHIFENLSEKSALLIGAGETGDLVAKHMLERGISTLKIANRTHEKADALARSLNATVVDYNSIANEFFKNDIVISATASPEFVITSEMLKESANGDGKKRVMAIDIAVPRDIDPKVSEYGNVFLYGLDDLKVIVDKNVEDRKSEVPTAEKIVEKSVGVYEKWNKEQKVVPTIKYLQKSFEDVRIEELGKNKHCATCSKRGEIDQITKRILNKILRAPITKLVENTDCSEEELNYLRNLFSREEHGKQ